MEQKLKDFIKEIGIDLSDLNHPLSREYNLILGTQNKNFIRCFEHLLKNLIVDISLIKRHSISDYNDYANKLKKKDISFWGERFEISWYAILLQRMKMPIGNMRRGKAGVEADFVFQLGKETFGIETTSLTFSEKSNKSDPIAKIKSCIITKENKSYANKGCILIIDISNLMFYRKILNNFSLTIKDLYKEIDSKYGAILLSEGYHIIEEDNFQYGIRVYDLIQKGIPLELENFIKQNLSPIDLDNTSNKTIFFKNS